ncbi:MAG TPA: hypothetical protein VJ725_17500 [Thermoanaerobaculia bacterium]|nr:hypothetical protein [Thermoanaerobaculia bacterium]
MARNIVLVPGVLGFERIKNLEYFNGVAAHLRNRFPGIRVFPANTVPLGTVALRAETLADQIVAAMSRGALDGSRPLHILAHSMGGLDARFLAAKNLRGLKPRIATITSIGTPHLGSPVASLLNQGNPLDILPPLLGLHGQVLDDLRANANAVHDLSEEAAHIFNAQCPDQPGIGYFEVVGIGREGFLQTSAFFLPTFLFVNARRGRNDGIVPFSSATRGRVPIAQWQGDHADLIGHNLDRPLGLPVVQLLQAYDSLVRRLPS